MIKAIPSEQVISDVDRCQFLRVFSERGIVLISTLYYEITERGKNNLSVGVIKKVYEYKILEARGGKQ